jgi:alpha-tubulin suppressor-like RCC1 family protein
MATPAQRTNTWTLDEWYDQAVAGTQGSYIGTKELWTWGRNLNQGQLGQNNRTSYSSPVQIPGTTWATPIIGGSASGGNSSVTTALKTDGTLWSWGYNEKGTLGQNNTTAYSSPVQVGTETTWAGGAMGDRNQFIVKTDGTLWTWGQNVGGELMHDNRTNLSSPKQVGTDTTWSGELGKIGSSRYSQVTLIKTDGTMWAAGKQDDFKELGTTPANTNYSSPVQIPGTWSKCSRGGAFAMAIKGDGTLWMWGNNQGGRLGQNEGPGGNSYSSPVQVGTDTTWSDINGASGGAYGIKTDGTLWSWGNGFMLGNGVVSSRSSPTQIGTGTDWSFLSRGGYNFMGAIKTDGTLWAWGANEYGQIAQNTTGSGSNDGISSPTQIPGTTWEQIASNNDGFYALKNI